MNLDIGPFSMAEILASYSDKIFRKGGTNELYQNVEEIID